MPIAVAMFTLNVFHPGILVWNQGRVQPQDERHELAAKPARTTTSSSSDA